MGTVYAEITLKNTADAAYVRAGQLKEQKMPSWAQSPLKTWT